MKMKKTKLQKTGAKIGALLTAGAIFISSLPGTMIYASAEADSGFSSAPQTELLDPLSASAAVSADSSASSLDLTQEAQSGQTDMPDQTSATALTDQTDVNQGDLTYEEDYIRQHLDFCDSEEYRTIMGNIRDFCPEYRSRLSGSWFERCQQNVGSAFFLLRFSRRWQGRRRLDKHA